MKEETLVETDEVTRNIINHLLQYPEDRVGSLMTIEFVDRENRFWGIITIVDALSLLISF